MKTQVKEINERLNRSKIGIREILSIIDMTMGDHVGSQAAESPYEVFEGVSGLIDRTVHGCRIGRYRPAETRNPFHTFEIHTEDGGTLGYLNMVYLSKPIPCYYLVYVEVLLPFRGRGLGCSILKAYKEIAEDRKAVALLDNIIPPEDPAYDIYSRLGWVPAERMIGESLINEKGHYMAYVPSTVKTRGIECSLKKALLKIMKKRPVVDMYDNEAMVKRTIGELRSLYKALESLFENELENRTSTPLMSFMFTKFATKMLGFKRRISMLLGYTGGESLEQIHISDHVRALPIQPFSLWGFEEGRFEIWEEGLGGNVRTLLEKLGQGGLSSIEGLPLYRRPYVVEWMEENDKDETADLKIADIFELGFDPTKLKELRHEGVDYMIERVSGGFLSSVEKKRALLPRIASRFSGMRIRNAAIEINPPCALIRNRGNIYILYKKVRGIHLEEALDELRTSPRLKEMNRAAGIDRAMIMTVKGISEYLVKTFGARAREEIENIVFFVPWNLDENRPDIMVDITGVFLNRVWIF
ncbi:MAG TPA: hypothetical protein PLR60_03340 [Syntrophorhabdaceae bacterium]|nr:hypothetical protein [Syntrophorhabdaceae bacterium]